MTATEVGDQPVFSVVIPTRNRPSQLRECLTSLANQTLPRSLFEVIVVDDGGTQALADVLATFSGHIDVRVLRQDRQGPAAARNRGMAAARGRILAFTDDDCRVAPDWLEQLAASFAQDSDVLVGGQVTNALGGNVFSATSQLIHELAYQHHNRDGDPRFFATNNMAVGAASLVRLGGFDPEFGVASEDRDLCARWHESGRKLCYVSDARVAHAHRLTFLGFCRQHFRYGRGAWRFHQSLRRRRRGRFARDALFHMRFLRGVIPVLSEHPRAWTIAALLGVWQVANLSGFMFEATLRRLISSGPSAKIS